jgi:photosystem II stability/assembly factor-like uncharacterized protein
VIIGGLVSLLGRRLIATLAALWVLLTGPVGVVSAELAPSTWTPLAALPHQSRSAIFALSVDPSNNQLLLAGSSEGTLLRSADGGSTWKSVHTGKAVFNTIAFSPYRSGLVLVGTRGGGALVSVDGGETWANAAGLDGRSVRAFSYSLTVIVAGTDKGVYVSQDGSSWSLSGLADRSIDAIAVAAIHVPVRVLAASDSPLESGSLPLFQSVDGGATWSQLVPPINGTFIVRLAAGPLPPTGNTRPLLVGTNGGLFASNDNGRSFTPLSGGDLLPSTDYTQIAFITDHFDRFYAASDGGGSGGGGLWRTNDSGASFKSLAPPVPSVTALAVSNDESPVLYVATFRPSDHVAELWVYHDTGGTPQGPPVTPTPFASGARTSPSPGSGSNQLGFLSSPQAPYVGLGLVAVLVILLAAVSHLRGRRR